VLSVDEWQDAIDAYGHKAKFRARDLYAAEKAAYSAYDGRVSEMEHTGEGVIPHEAKSAKAKLTLVLLNLTWGDEKRFNDCVQEYAIKAREDLVNYSPLSYGLQTAAGHLATIHAQKKAGAARG
jgi:hypothetical protein